MALAPSTTVIGRGAGHRAATAAAAVVLLLCLAAALAGDRLVRSAAIGEERADVLARLPAYSNALSLAINRRLAALIGLKAFVEVRWAEPGFANEFDAFAAAVQSATPGILSLQYVLDGRVAHMFPSAGNEKALGLDLYKHPDLDVRRGLLLAERSRSVALTGPRLLAQGGMGLVGRMGARDASGGLLCVVTSVFLVEPLFGEAGLDRAEGLVVALEDETGRVLAGPASLLADDPVEVAALLPDRRWTIAAKPAAGWGTIGTRRVAWYRAAAAAFSLLFAALTWVLVAAQAARAREAEQRTRRAGDERFARLYQLVPEGVLLTRLSDHAILEVNDHFVAIVGYTREELVGSTSLGLRLWVDPPDRQRVRTLLDSEGVVTNHLVRFRRKDGSEGDAQVSFRLFDLQGEPCVLSIVRDVTEARELQQKLAQAQKLEAIGTLAGGIAHDFNNIISVIANYAELAKGGLPQPSPAREDLEQISEASRRAARLVRQLLAFSRKQVVQPSAVDLDRLVGDTSELLRRVLPANIAVETAAAARPAFVLADRGQLEQVLLNLALNARDAMPAGGKLTLATARTEEEVALSVSDEGVGIPAALRSKIFEPFFTTKAPGKGTGLGLATCYGIVKQAGGRLELQSEPGAGSTFRATFPRLADGAVPEPLAKGRPEAPVGGTETLLFAEDDPQLRAATARMLSSLGYRVLSASGGKEALEHARRHEGAIDLLVTDVMMPELDGRELSARLEGEISSLRTLFLSAYADAKGIEAAIREGKAFLGKPFTIGQLAAAVRSALGRG